MTVAECKTLKVGDPVRVSLGGGWYITGEFIGFYQTTSYGRVTIDTIDQIDWSKGKTQWTVFYRYMEDGRWHNGSCSPMAAQKAE